MSRCALLSLLALPLIIAGASSCEVGDVTTAGTPQVTTDATAAEDGGGEVTPDATAADPNCSPAAAPNGNGQHNAGTSCIDQGCHDGGGPPPKWTLSGTLYTDIEGTTPLAGGTIIFTDANAQEIKLITASNGNFYTGDPIAFPITVKGSRCPNTVPMIAPVTAAQGSCNLAGCHGAGNRSYVPE